jgi:chromosomal replication initiation ATPase DnaA
MSPALLAIRKERARLLAEMIGEEMGLPPEDILGVGRDRVVIAARHRLWRMLIDSGLSLNVVAEVVNCHHTTIHYAMRKLRRADQKARLEDGNGTDANE